MKFRTLNKWRAKRGNYFWIHCPLCGEMFGGHEWLPSKPGMISSIPNGKPGGGTGICPDCTRAGKGYRSNNLPVFRLELDEK